MIKIIQSILTLSLLTILFTSCVTTKIDSNKSSDFNQKVSRIYITARGSDSSKEFMKALTNYLKVELNKHGVESMVYYFDPLSLETEKDLGDKINNYNPDVVMSIGQTERRSTAGPYGGVTETGATLDIRLFVPNRDNPVWRGSLKADGSFGVGTTSQSSAIKIVEKLKLDGVIN